MKTKHLTNRYYGDVINTGKEIDERIEAVLKEYRDIISRCQPIADECNKIIFNK